MESVKILMKEHDHILRMLDVVHKACLMVLGGEAVPDEDFKLMIDFIRKYADQTHHGKEEEYFFRAMLDELGPVAEKLIRNGMLVEHDLGRLYVSDLEQALTSYQKQPENNNKLAILVAAGSYEQLLRRHIQKENEVVFTFGKKQLPSKSAAWVEDGFKSFEADAGNSQEREHQLMILDQLECKYLPGNTEK